MPQQTTLKLPMPEISDAQLLAAAETLPTVHGYKPSESDCLNRPAMRRALELQVIYGEQRHG